MRMLARMLDIDGISKTAIGADRENRNLSTAVIADQQPSSARVHADMARARAPEDTVSISVKAPVSGAM